MKQLPVVQRLRQGGVNFVMVGLTHPSNSDNQNGDGGGLVFAYAQVGVHACVCDVLAIYDNNTLPRLITIIIKIIFLYFIQIAHTDDFFPSTGTRLVIIIKIIFPYFKQITHSDDFTLNGYPSSHHHSCPSTRSHMSVKLCPPNAWHSRWRCR